MSNLIYLSWDSEFFSKKIGSITIDGQISKQYLINTLEQAKTDGYEILYLTDNSNNLVNNEIITQLNGDLIDEKITYKKTPKKHIDSKRRVINYESQILHNDLIELAYISGTFSRFKRDTRFTENDFKKLYRKWIERSVQKELADEVFVYKDNEEILGFITIKIQAQQARVGLIAVNPNQQGKNIGGQLIKKAENYLFNEGIIELFVSTQGINFPAIQFYLQNKFEFFSKQSIYHL